MTATPALGRSNLVTKVVKQTPQPKSVLSEKVLKLAKKQARGVSVDASRRDILNLGAATGFVGCFCELCGAPPAKADGWGYGTTQTTIEIPAPNLWGRTCATGTQQSPVNLNAKDARKSEGLAAVNEGRLVFLYNRTEKCIVSNTGHGTMQVSFPPGNRMAVGDKFLELVQFHFHTPSEHALDGVRCPIEAHLVHRDLYTGKLVVLGVMLERANKSSGGNPCLRLALETAPKPGDSPVQNAQTSFDPSLLLPRAKQSYIHYMGSLTTPPCDEAVSWYVFTESLPVTDTEILDFQQFCGGGADLGRNARPLQPSNERYFTYFNDV